ncbi:hypothetical protein NDU88_004981 [Pleurodeles waltl]|uniref:Uncharacterized protein n=1 Tax=Pleurodeles waltl TaxID=8319 RepID=A0AAV7LLD6_PLEWA|nr:hypothetical protein NDU88_004981 [Pleurodeles waltl]
MGAWLSHLTWWARAGRAPRRNRLKQRLDGGAGGGTTSRAGHLDPGDALGLPGLEPPRGGCDSRVVPRSCRPRHEAELRRREWGAARARPSAASAAGAARKDWTSAGPLAGDPLSNR